jgi:uncharacterized membrane protein
MVGEMYRGWSLEAVKEVILPFLCARLLGVLLVARFWLRCWLSHDWLLSIGFGHLEVVCVVRSDMKRKLKSRLKNSSDGE